MEETAQSPEGIAWSKARLCLAPTWGDIVTHGWDSASQSPGETQWRRQCLTTIRAITNSHGISHPPRGETHPAMKETVSYNHLRHCQPWRRQCPRHDGVIKWKHFPRYWPFVRGMHWWPVDSPHKGQWRWAWMFSLSCVRTSDWANHRNAGDLRRNRAHYDVTVIINQRKTQPDMFEATTPARRQSYYWLKHLPCSQPWSRQPSTAIPGDTFNHGKVETTPHSHLTSLAKLSTQILSILYVMLILFAKCDIFFTNNVNWTLDKPSLDFNTGLAKQQLPSRVKWDRAWLCVLGHLSLFHQNKSLLNGYKLVYTIQNDFWRFSQ